MQVLLVGPSETLPAGIDHWLTQNQWSVTSAPDVASAAAAVNSSAVDAVVVSTPENASPEVTNFLRFVDARRIATVAVGAEARRLPVADGSLIDPTPAKVTKEELSWRLSTLTRFQVHVKRMEHELEHMQKLGKRLNQHFREIDDEMRLASRLQRDFLPRDVDRIGPLRFTTLYRPASWVSGDIFDIERVDDRHVAFYVADAVGHGMSAGLLTMFIKRSIVTHRMRGPDCEITDPSEALLRLNDALASHTLPHCQFVTGVYCLVDIETMTLSYARGGHPYPVLISADGHLTELKSTGGLMGLFPGFECPTRQVQLSAGDKLILYTDGIETALDEITPSAGANGSAGAVHKGHLGVFESLAGLPASDLSSRLTTMLETKHGSLQPEDDVTVVILEVSP